MFDLIRSAPLGQLIRVVTRNRLLQYPEEALGFQCPLCYKGTDGSDPNVTDTKIPSKYLSLTQASPQSRPTDDIEAPPQHVGPFDENNVERGDGGRSGSDQTSELDSAETHRPRLGRVNTLKSLQNQPPGPSSKRNS